MSNEIINFFEIKKIGTLEGTFFAPLISIAAVHTRDAPIQISRNLEVKQAC